MSPSRTPNGLGESALQRLLRAVEQFLSVESASAALLLLATAAALIWANAPGSTYDELWLTPVPGRLLPAVPLQFWINEILMTVFFLLVGLEIRAEWHDGVLSQLKFALLPIAAALGGIIAPALIFLALNRDPLLRQGWAVPIATDIAFSAGALTLLGRRVPASLRVLLLTLAIVDDIAAVLVIATFYSGGIAWQGLLIGACGVAGVLGLRMLGIQRTLAYALAGAVIWYGLLQAAIHPTLAGVLLGIAMPVSVGKPLGERLHRWVAYLIMPLFALANAGVGIRSLGMSITHYPSVVAGVLFGLVIGKPVGILCGSFVCVKSGLGALAPSLRWRHLVVLGCLGGIGFTMAIFMVDLAFPPGELLSGGKAAVLAASVLAGLVGLALGRFLLPRAA